jgi:hypothetical protein
VEATTKKKRKGRDPHTKGRIRYGIKPGPGRPRSYILRDIPEGLWEATKEYAVGTHRPIRDIILTLLASMQEIRGIMIVKGHRIESDRVLRKDIEKGKI